MTFKVVRMSKGDLDSLTDADRKDILEMFNDLIKNDHKFLKSESEIRTKQEPLKSLTELTKSNSIVLVGTEADNTLAGGCTVRTVDMGTFKMLALSFVFVKPKYRGQGAGKALMDYVAKIAKDSGCAEVYLTVHTANKDAIRLYEKSGFVGHSMQMGKSIK